MVHGYTCCLVPLLMLSKMTQIMTEVESNPPHVMSNPYWTGVTGSSPWVFLFAYILFCLLGQHWGLKSGPHSC
jgi:hypothetical protein